MLSSVSAGFALYSLLSPRFLAQGPARAGLSVRVCRVNEVIENNKENIRKGKKKIEKKKCFSPSSGQTFTRESPPACPVACNHVRSSDVRLGGFLKLNVIICVFPLALQCLDNHWNDGFLNTPDKTCTITCFLTVSLLCPFSSSIKSNSVINFIKLFFI